MPAETLTREQSLGNILILGATSTIARALVAKFAAGGNDLILAGRDLEELDALAADLRIRYGVRTKVQPFDALELESHEAMLNSCLSEAGDTLEGVVACFGFLGDQSRAQTDFAEAKRILDVNLTGCISVLNIVANYFEQKGSGFICALSSVAGDRGRRSNYVYGAAKAGLSIYLEGLGHRLSHANVHVVTIKPGVVDTSMTFGRPGLFLAASPEAVAREIYRAIRKRKNVAYVPWFWRVIMFVIRCLPSWAFKRLHL